MHKVFRRTLLAEKQAARRLAAKKVTKKRDLAKSIRQQIAHTRKEETADLKQARLVRREDYELGPLAPRRDVGDKVDSYGSIGGHRTQRDLLRPKVLMETLKSVGGVYMNIVAGDRVVLLEGKDKGKIGKVLQTDKMRASCTVEGMNVADVFLPKYMVSPEDPDQRPVRSVEIPVPITSVRLVHPLTDPKTGITRDVIVKKVINSKIWYDRHTGTRRWSRIIPGLDIVIPWPHKDPKQHNDGPNDTLRMEVEERSFVPTLLRPPMPSTVIDELRNKFSKFRTRHDPEFIELKEKEEEALQEKKLLIKKMRTPLSEANRKARKDRKALGKGKLTKPMLEKIGEVIASKRQIALEGAGVTVEQFVRVEPESA